MLKVPLFQKYKSILSWTFISCISVLYLPSPGVFCWLRGFCTWLNILLRKQGPVTICEDQNMSGLTWCQMEDDLLEIQMSGQELDYPPIIAFTLMLILPHFIFALGNNRPRFYSPSVKVEVITKQIKYNVLSNSQN